MGGVGSGRVAKDTNTRQIQQTMTEAAVHGAKLIRDYLRDKDVKPVKGAKKVKPVTFNHLKAAIDAINHAIGLPKAKIELKTDALSLKEIAELAATFGASGDIITVPLRKDSVEKVASDAKN